MTLTIPPAALLSAARWHGAAEVDSDRRARLAALARIAGPDPRRFPVRIALQPSALRRWWDFWAWRRGVGGAARSSGRERRLNAFLAPVEPDLGEPAPCEGRPHVHAVAAAPLSWNVIDELDRCVSAGREVHLVLSLPRSPVSRDPDLHVLWERRMALDVADREREVALLWPGIPLVRIAVVRKDPTADHHRWSRRWDRRKR